MPYKPFYDPQKSYYENFEQGPFGDFADREIFLENEQPQNELFVIKYFLLSAFQLDLF